MRGAAARAPAPMEPRSAPVREEAAFDASAGDLGSWLDQIDEPFSTTLLALIDEHISRTGSPKAKRLVAGWADVRPYFTKVLPAHRR